MNNMGNAQNGFLKSINPSPKSERMTIREAVTRWGDDWRLMYPGCFFTRREYMERETSDTWDGLDMRAMELGQKSRIKVEDIPA